VTKPQRVIGVNDKFMRSRERSLKKNNAEGRKILFERGSYAGDKRD
jgi:hypothetical protein